MRSSTPLRVGGLALAGIVIASVAVISAGGGDTSVAGRVALASVRRGTVTSYVSAAGNTVDTGVRDLAFGAEGMVEKVYVTVGQKVRRGKVLARIDDTIARENYEAAKAALAAARETLENVKNGTATTGGAAPSAGGSGARASTGGPGIGTGTQSGPGAGTGTGASAGGTGRGSTGGTGTPSGTTGSRTGVGSANGAGTGTASGAGAGNANGTGGAGTGTGAGTASGAGAGNANGTGGAGTGTGAIGGSGPVTCPTPSVRPSAQPSTRPSAPTSGRPSTGASLLTSERPSTGSSAPTSERPPRRSSALATERPFTGSSSSRSASSSSSSSPRSSAQRAAQPAAWSTIGASTNAIAADVRLVAHTTGYQGGYHDGPAPEPSPAPSPEPSATPAPEPSPEPTATRTRTPRRHHHPRPKPSGTHRPDPTDGGATAPDPVVTVSALPTVPAPQPSATPSPSPSGSSPACTPGQGGQGQGTQGQGTRGQGGGAAGRTGFGGGRRGQASQGGQGSRGGLGGQGGGARLTEAQAEAQVSQATTELAEAEKALDGVKIKAPADGTILSVAGTTGSRYTSGTFITLGDLDALQVQALFTESDIRFLKVGQAATVTLSTEPGKEYAGTVVHIDPTPTTSNRLVRYGVTIDLKNRPARMLLGQSATVRVTTEEAADALYVPSQAVRAQGDGTAVVTVADGGTQVRRTVKVGVRGDTYVEIIDGLSEGDQVVLPGTTTAFPDEGFPAVSQPTGR